MKSYKKNDKIGQRLRMIVTDIKKYIEKRLELTVLDIGDSLSDWVASSVQRLIGAALLLLGVSFALVALAIYLGELIGSVSLGYLLVSLPLLILGFLFLALKPVGIYNLIQRHFDDEFMNTINKSVASKTQELESPESVVNEETKNV